jgi:hypothetical protein
MNLFKYYVISILFFVCFNNFQSNAIDVDNLLQKLVGNNSGWSEDTICQLDCIISNSSSNKCVYRFVKYVFGSTLKEQIKLLADTRPYVLTGIRLD